LHFVRIESDTNSFHSFEKRFSLKPDLDLDVVHLHVSDVVRDETLLVVLRGLGCGGDELLGFLLIFCQGLIWEEELVELLIQFLSHLELNRVDMYLNRVKIFPNNTRQRHQFIRLDRHI
jgi:hypothetical protein